MKYKQADEHETSTWVALSHTDFHATYCSLQHKASAAHFKIKQKSTFNPQGGLNNHHSWWFLQCGHKPFNTAMAWFYLCI